MILIKQNRQAFGSIVGDQWRLKGHPSYQQLAGPLSPKRFQRQSTIFHQLCQWQATEMGLFSWSYR